MPDLLRETFEEYALRAPSADGLRAGVDARARRLRVRRRSTVAAAAVSAAAVVAGVLAATGDPVRRPAPVVSEAPSPTVSPAPRLAAEPPAPPGMRWAMFRGVEVAAPAAWFDARFDACGAPLTDAVLVGPTPSDGDCALHPSPEHDSVFVSTIVSSRPDLPPAVVLDSEEEVTVHGMPARRGRGRSQGAALVAEGKPVETLAFPERNLMVVVATEDRALAERILGTVRVSTGSDSRGCLIRLDALYATDPPDRPGARDVMVPGTPVQASVCRYGRDGLVILSSLVTDPRGLAAAFNGLSPGAGNPNDPVTGDTFLVTFRYAEGPDVLVWAHQRGVRGAGATNGAVSGHGEEALRDAFRPLVGWVHRWDDSKDWYDRRR